MAKPLAFVHELRLGDDVPALTVLAHGRLHLPSSFNVRAWPILPRRTVELGTTSHHDVRMPDSRPVVEATRGIKGSGASCVGLDLHILLSETVRL
ncbi:hypothetical protein GCM10023354_17220 [Garicola koreensis]